MIIDLLQRMPDWAIGGTAAVGLWFGFNYAVLAERAMAREAQTETLSACIAALEEHEANQQVPDLGIADMFGLPQLEVIERQFERLAQPRLMDAAEKTAKCVCASQIAGRSARFDYAIYTASFRVIAPESVSALRDTTVGKVLGGACGALPTLRVAK
jgi:hypothetical protein